jgi:chromosome partitioning protein
VHATRFTGLYVLPASPELDHLERKLESKHKIYKLRDLLIKLGESFDQVFIDTAPAFNFYTRSALIAAMNCLIPFDCDDFSRQALYTIFAEIQDLRTDHNPDLFIEGIVANQFQPRARLPLQIIESLREEGLPVLPVFLNASIKMRESHQAHEPLVYFAPGHALTRQFEDLYRLLQHEKAPA